MATVTWRCWSPRGWGAASPTCWQWPAEVSNPSPCEPRLGWSEDDWNDAVATLTGAGLLTDGTLSEQGRRFHDHIEARTDELAAAPYVALGESGREALRDGLIPLAAAVVGSGWLPFPNPIGLPNVAGA